MLLGDWVVFFLVNKFEDYSLAELCLGYLLQFKRIKINFEDLSA